MQSNSTEHWPPQYTLRHSKRARRVSLKICELRGLEVVMPYGMSEAMIAPLLNQHRAWIEQKLKDRPQRVLPELPSVIELGAISQTWRVAREIRNTELVRCYPNRMTQTLILQGPDGCTALFKQLVKKWLMNMAKKHLRCMMDQLCEQHGFCYNRLSIRAAKTRWGSCSSKKNISLNYKLLLMPYDYACHIILHELCHTVHLNHSAKFWRLLAEVDPHWHIHHQQTRDYKTDLTRWLDLG